MEGWVCRVKSMSMSKLERGCREEEESKGEEKEGREEEEEKEDERRVTENGRRSDVKQQV